MFIIFITVNDLFIAYVGTCDPYICSYFSNTVDVIGTWMRLVLVIVDNEARTFIYRAPFKYSTENAHFNQNNLIELSLPSLYNQNSWILEVWVHCTYISVLTIRLCNYVCNTTMDSEAFNVKKLCKINFDFVSV